MAFMNSDASLLVIRQTWITREDLRANRNVTYVFGDDVAHKEHRGLARHMRNEPNAHAISIGWAPHEPFSLTTSEAAIARMDADLDALVARASTIIVWPLSGLVPEFQSMPEELRLYLRSKVHKLFNLADPI